MKIQNQMSFEVFTSVVEEKILECLGEGYYAKRQQVVKNNGVTLESIIFRKVDEIIVPSIYMNTYYEDYVKGRLIEDICRDVLDTYLKTKAKQPDKFSEFTNRYESIKQNIVYRIINYEKNKVMLEEVPHIKVMDFAITFHYLVREDEDGVGTIRITKEHCKQWGIATKELYQIAMKNTPSLFPALIRPMEEVMLELMKKEVAAYMDDGFGIRKTELEKEVEAEQAANEFIQMLHNENPNRYKVNMYVLTNVRGINGASCILYPEVLSDFADEIGSDYFILPSSIHELILVPYEEHLGIKELKEMVMEINDTQVPVEEILSNDIYCYSREKKKMLGIA